MPKSAGSTTQTTMPDAATAARGRDVWNAAQNAAENGMVGASPYTTAAARGYADMASQGNLGFGALGGDPTAVARLMSPFQQNVIDKMNAQYGRDRTATINSVNDEATAANAFGGSRHGVAEGVALGQLGQGHEGQMANLLNQGYSDAMGRAGTLANLGFGAQGALANIGQYLRGVDLENNPAMRKFLFEQQAMQSMPQGSTSTTTQHNGSNWASGLLGLGVTGLSLASGLGWAPFAAKGLSSISSIPGMSPELMPGGGY